MTSPATLNMEIPNGPAVNFMIGKGGASIRDMQAKSNCHIAVQKEAEVMPGSASWWSHFRHHFRHLIEAPSADGSDGGRDGGATAAPRRETESQSAAGSERAEMC